MLYLHHRFIEKSYLTRHGCTRQKHAVMYLGSISRIVYYLWNADEMEDIMDFVESNFKEKSRTSLQKLDCKIWVKWSRIFSCVWVFFVAFISTIMTITPLILNNSDEYVLPVPVWPIFDWKNNFTLYILLYVGQGFLQIMLANGFTTCEVVVIALTLQMRGQLELLGYEMKNIFRTALSFHGVPKTKIDQYFKIKTYRAFEKQSDVSGLKLFPKMKNSDRIQMEIEHVIYSEGYQRTLHRILDTIISDHQILLKCSKMLQAFVSSIFLVGLFLGMTHIIFVAFVIIISDDNSLIIVLIMYLQTSALEYFVLSYFPHMLSDDSIKIRYDLYTCPWYLGDKIFRTKIIFMLHRLEKPLGVRGGSYFSFSIHLFIKMGKTFFSYITFLRQVTRHLAKK